jgi:Fe-S oxidoreductase
LLTLRDEYQALFPGEEASALADNAFLFEEFLLHEHQARRLPLALKPLPQKQALVHGHCHQKAFAVMGAVRQVLEFIPDLNVELIESSCCGMAGSFGYEAEHYDTSMAMANLSLIPAIAEANSETLIVADGTSCRSQIQHGSGREALHVARVLQMALDVH